MKERFKRFRFSAETSSLIETANEIIDDFTGRGYTLTLRQLYYQFVARALIENSLKSYKRLASIVNDARLAGELDWSAIEDRTRELSTPPSWTSPQDILDTAAKAFRLNPWERMENRVEVWVEKEALAGVVEKATREVRVPFFSCRGYTSQSELYGAAERFREYLEEGKTVTVIHLGDHDPSGIDMTRDIEERLELFLSCWGFPSAIEVNRIALNFDQVKQYKPPPNPAKATDARFGGYRRKFGSESWELDALDPDTLHKLIVDEVSGFIDSEIWDEVIDEERRERARLAAVCQNWEKLAGRLDKLSEPAPKKKGKR